MKFTLTGSHRPGFYAELASGTFFDHKRQVKDALIGKALLTKAFTRNTRPQLRIAGENLGTATSITFLIIRSHNFHR